MASLAEVGTKKSPLPSTWEVDDRGPLHNSQQALIVAILANRGAKKKEPLAIDFPEGKSRTGHVHQSQQALSGAILAKRGTETKSPLPSTSPQGNR